MNAVWTLLLLLVSSQAFALEKEPWLGNWLEFEGALYQTHTQSKSVDTANGSRQKFLHAERTTASLEFMPLVNLSTEIALDFAKTQKRAYGFEAFKAAMRYSLFNDLTGDLLSVSTGVAASLSTPSRVKDLSSVEHGVCELEAQLALGREFGYAHGGFYRVWAYGLAGVASSGSPWLSGKIELDRILHDRHFFALFFRAERGLSSQKLRHLSDFHSWSQIGYRFEELGLKYTFKQMAVGSFYLQCTTRIHARYCPKDSWSVQLGMIIPFSPW